MDQKSFETRESEKGKERDYSKRTLHKISRRTQRKSKHISAAQHAHAHVLAD